MVAPSRMVELPAAGSEMERRGSPALEHKSCTNGVVQAVRMTAQVVYFRCGGCGDVWTIPQRRRNPRADDPRSF